MSPREWLPALSTDEQAELLRRGNITVQGRLLDSSNSALVVEIDDELAVYKPVVGERPLWDFPTGTLAHREVATYELSDWLGLDLVPMTVWREDGPAGPGSVQRWIEPDDSLDVIAITDPQQVPPAWHRIVEGRGSHDELLVVSHSDDPQLRLLAVFDALINNADRKGGHLLASNGRLFAIDHGLTFNVELKLRTVLWGFAGTSLTEELVEVLNSIQERTAEFTALLTPHLRVEEITMTQLRAQDLSTYAVFPTPQQTGPAIPWPII